MRSRTRVISVAAGVLAAAVAAGVTVALSGSPAAGLPPAQQARLERGITAPTVAAESVVVARQVRAQFVRSGRTLLPAGARLQVEAASFRVTGAGTATVDAVVTGPAAGRWQLLLVREGGRWLLIDSRRLR